MSQDSQPIARFVAETRLQFRNLQDVGREGRVEVLGDGVERRPRSFVGLKPLLAARCRLLKHFIDPSKDTDVRQKRSWASSWTTAGSFFLLWPTVFRLWVRKRRSETQQQMQCGDFSSCVIWRERMAGMPDDASEELTNEGLKKSAFLIITVKTRVSIALY